MSNVSPRRIYATSLLYAFIVAVFISGLIALTWYESLRREQQRVETRFEICQEIETVKKVQRADITSGIEASQTFLKAHPEGIPGIPPRLIQAGIDQKKKTLLALAPNDCRKFAVSGSTD